MTIEDDVWAWLKKRRADIEAELEALAKTDRIARKHQLAGQLEVIEEVKTLVNPLGAWA